MDIELKIIILRFLRGIRLFFKYATFKKIINSLIVETERRFCKSIVAGSPYFIKIQTASKCDSGCRYCLSNVSTSGSTMHLETFKKIIDKNKQYLYLAALHFSGESLFNENIYFMIKYAHENRVATYLSTNFQHFKKNDAETLILSGLDLLTVTLDGATERTYRSYKKNGDLHTVLDNLSIVVKTKKKLKSKWPILNMQFLVTSYNEGEVDAIRKIARELNVDSLELKPLGVRDKKLLPKNGKYLRSFYKGKSLEKNPCWWLWSAFVVLVNGEMIPCCSPYYSASSNDHIGNLAEDGPDQVKNSKILQQLRNDFHSSKELGINCLKCPIPYGNLLRHTL